MYIYIINKLICVTSLKIAIIKYCKYVINKYSKEKLIKIVNISKSLNKNRITFLHLIQEYNSFYINIHVYTHISKFKHIYTPVILLY